jgi:hypothetical protein
VDRDSYNWGRVTPGSELNVSFVIRNRGWQPLRFGDPKTSCGCARPLLSVKELPPGGRTTLRVSFQAPVNPGPVAHFVQYPTNDPDRPSLLFNLFAESWLGVRSVPQAIDAGELRRGDLVERTVQFFSPDGKPFRLGSIFADLVEVRASAETPNVALAAHRVHVFLRAGRDLGPLRGSLRVLTDRTDAPVVDVPIAARTAGPVSVSPSFLQITREEIGEAVHRTLFLASVPSGEAVSLTSLRASPPWELVSHSSRALGRGRLGVDVTLRFPRGAGAPSGELRLAVHSREAADYRVPLMILGWTRPIPVASEE